MTNSKHHSCIHTYVCMFNKHTNVYISKSVYSFNKCRRKLQLATVQKFISVHEVDIVVAVAVVQNVVN